MFSKTLISIAAAGIVAVIGSGAAHAFQPLKASEIDAGSLVTKVDHHGKCYKWKWDHGQKYCYKWRYKKCYSWKHDSYGNKYCYKWKWAYYSKGYHKGHGGSYGGGSGY